VGAPGADQALVVLCVDQDNLRVTEQPPMYRPCPAPELGMQGARVAVDHKVASMDGAPEPSDKWCKDGGRDDDQRSWAQLPEKEPHSRGVPQVAHWKEKLCPPGRRTADVMGLRTESDGQRRCASLKSAPGDDGDAQGMDPPRRPSPRRKSRHPDNRWGEGSSPSSVARTDSPALTRSPVWSEIVRSLRSSSTNSTWEPSRMTPMRRPARKASRLGDGKSCHRGGR